MVSFTPILLLHFLNPIPHALIRILYSLLKEVGSFSFHTDQGLHGSAP